MPAHARRPRGTKGPNAPASAVAHRGSLLKFVVVAILVTIVAVVIARKPSRAPSESALSPAAVAPAAQPSHAAATPTAGIPRLVDIGADKCIPCKAMAPILVELRKEYAGRMEVEFVDVWKNPAAGDPYRISLIPTQVFFDEYGRELHRHEGFIGKADILATWKRLGYDFTLPGPMTPTS